MRPIGFSTEAFIDRTLAEVVHLISLESRVIELVSHSVLDLKPLLISMYGPDTFNLDLYSMDKVSIRLPKYFNDIEEIYICRWLYLHAFPRPLILVRPRNITEPAMCMWEKEFGQSLCFEDDWTRENLKEKAEQLEKLYEKLPQAGFCLDLGKIRQEDPTMGLARLLLRRFGSRLKQVRLSEIDSKGKHCKMSVLTQLACQTIADMIPEDVRVIIDSEVSKSEMVKEMITAQIALHSENSRYEGYDDAY